MPTQQGRLYELSEENFHLCQKLEVQVRYAKLL